LFSSPKVHIVSPVDGTRFTLDPQAARSWLIDTVLSLKCDDHAVRSSLPATLTLLPLCSVDRSFVDTIGVSVVDGPGRYSAAGAGAGTEIAIVGMSCRVPGAESLEAFWDLLEKGLDMHRTVSVLLSRLVCRLFQF
jgi:hypothetical protein